jgi:D-glycero-alpha-D-manno-heptose-7-phosphate kinase
MGDGLKVLQQATRYPAVQKKLRRGDHMIVSRTPLRISFVGGGTDIPEYYRHNGGGAVVNAAISKYVYIIINKKFDDQVRVSYSKTEIVPSAEDIQHPLVREALKSLDIRKGVEIVSISDIPSYGTGLGSSSTFTVGLLNALHAWVGENASAKELAEEAVRIEREVVGDPGGRQDQYIAAYGGMRFMEFHPDDTVDVRPIVMRGDAFEDFQNNLLMFYTGKTRSGSTILRGQIEEVADHSERYHAMRQLAYDLKEDLEHSELSRVGMYLHENWEHKRQLHPAISDSTLSKVYDRARSAGAIGGKITGAGGGGFLLIYAPLSSHPSVRAALADLPEEHFRLELSGSRVSHVDA